MNTTNTTLPYKDSSRPVDERVEDLLARMTIEEKVAQMLCVWQQKPAALVDDQGRFDEAKARERFGHGHGLGQVGRPSDAGGGLTARAMAETTNAIQRFFVEQSRLGIPVIFHEECLHGHAAREGTSFPQPIGLASTFDPDLVERVYTAVAAEARARGAHQALAPDLDVARDPRWGRTEETFGEDPYLIGCMGVAAVRGFQGDGRFAGKTRVAATVKHFAAHGEPEAGTNCAPVNVSMRVLREVCLPAFERAIVEGGALSVMPSYNEIDGVPSHANRWLLGEVLRGEWGFRGFVVSDYFAIRELNERPELYGHHLAHDTREAAALAVRAGVDIELPDPDCYPALLELVREGVVPESLIDERVRPMLHAKFRLGLFDDPYVDPAEAERIVRDPAHREVALEAARKTITLLKNDGVLPIDASAIRRIAVIGPNADRVMLGGYSGVPLQVGTALQGIRDRVPPGVEVLYHEGCKLTIGGSWNQDEVTPSDPDEDRRSIREAAEVAARADLVVLAIGDNEQTSREAWALNHMGDRASLELFGLQDELVNAIAETGKPIVALLFSGRPASIRNLAARAGAILELWYLGQESGRAIAEALFGDLNPGGKLPITIPRSVGHVPAFYNHKPSARRGYLFESSAPLFAFGYGLSYTTFAFSNLRLERDTIRAGESTHVLVDVTNTGSRRGDEVVQLYVRDLVSSVTRPVKELKGFRRVTLDPGETTTVSLAVTPDALAFYDIDMKYKVEPGDFRLMVGSSSRDEDLQTLTLHVTA
ncbi:MAG TPA: glycoside hydrolase family 3 N-terminal domain-containing protein [Vicinamibacterales bacterium]|nr:glycoside hydrolase family 3 C-terminal domain-containing protein [Acidobacteriota bacterium]HOC19532.1 glycoside hydrolase family 3 N-terminal domain-containing protein [Vicinamibacterales bacterium]